MVLERLIGVRQAIKQPMWIFFLGAMISLISMFVSFIVFSKLTGLFVIIVITLAMTPFMNRLLIYEEKENVKLMRGHSFFERYSDIITAYVAFFSGMILAMSVVFVVTPEVTVQRIFDEQINEINIIRGKFLFGNQLLEIFTNNVSVVTLSFLFSFLFGSGAVFILSWNASVLSAAIGLLAKAAGGFHGIPGAIMVFLPHGSFEILAYFIGAIAGGIMSATIIKRKSVNFWLVAGDSMKLYALSIFLLLIAGVIETALILL